MNQFTDKNSVVNRLLNKIVIHRITTDFESVIELKLVVNLVHFCKKQGYKTGPTRKSVRPDSPADTSFKLSFALNKLTFG